MIFGKLFSENVFKWACIMLEIEDTKPYDYKLPVSAIFQQYNGDEL